MHKSIPLTCSPIELLPTPPKPENKRKLAKKQKHKRVNSLHKTGNSNLHHRHSISTTVVHQSPPPSFIIITVIHHRNLNLIINTTQILLRRHCVHRRSIVTTPSPFVLPNYVVAVPLLPWSIFYRSWVIFSFELN
jgi:hypothetical protein